MDGTAPQAVDGPNGWLVDEMRERWQSDPASVTPEWQQLFAGNTVTAPPRPPAAPPPAAAAPPAAPAAAPVPAATARVPELESRQPAPSLQSSAEGAQLLRGAAARIVQNMEASLEVPTATSFRVVPAKLLEVNRTVINGYLGRTLGGKVSFTHIIGFAVVQAMADMPAMLRSYTEVDGKPAVVHHDRVGLGLAVDVERD